MSCDHTGERTLFATFAISFHPAAESLVETGVESTVPGDRLFAALLAAVSTAISTDDVMDGCLARLIAHAAVIDEHNASATLTVTANQGEQQ